MSNENKHLGNHEENCSMEPCVPKSLLEEKIENLQRMINYVSENQKLICDILVPTPSEALAQDHIGNHEREGKYLSSILDQVIFDLEILHKEQEALLMDLQRRFGKDLHL